MATSIPKRGVEWNKRSSLNIGDYAGPDAGFLARINERQIAIINIQFDPG